MRRSSLLAIAAVLALVGCTSGVGEAAKNLDPGTESDGSSDATDNTDSTDATDSTDDRSDPGNSDRSDRSDSTDGTPSDSSDDIDDAAIRAALATWQTDLAGDGFTDRSSGSAGNSTIEIEDARRIIVSDGCEETTRLVDDESVTTADFSSSVDSPDLARDPDAAHPVVEVVSLDIRVTTTDSLMSDRFDIMSNPVFGDCAGDAFIGSLFLQAAELSDRNVKPGTGPPLGDQRIGFVLSGTLTNEALGTMQFSWTADYVRVGRMMVSINTLNLGPGKKVFDPTEQLRKILQLTGR